jgi:ribosomal subunit interface protein
MNLSVKAKNISLTDAIRSYVETKIGALETKVARWGESVSCEVEVGLTTKHHKKGPIFRAEVHVRLPGNLVYAEAEDLNLYVALGDAKKEAERQILAYKGSRDAKMKRGARQARGK